MKCINIALTLGLLSSYSCSKDQLTEDNYPQQHSKVITLSEINCPNQITIYSPAEADIIVNNIEELIKAIEDAQEGDIIYIEDNANLQFSDSTPNIVIDKSIKIVSGRSFENTGATLYRKKEVYDALEKRVFIHVIADNVTLSGLNIKGFDQTNNGTSTTTNGILITNHTNLTVENCELSGWSHGAIFMINSSGNHIINNYIHHNQRNGFGYGVVLHHDNDDTETNAQISCNNFDYNRHDIAASGHQNESYEASYNIIGTQGTSHSFDMHGKNGDSETIAGKSVTIHHNTFKNKDQIAVVIRGIPEDKALIHDNIFPHDYECESIRQIILDESVPWYTTGASDFLIATQNNTIKRYTFGKFKKMAAYNNSYASDDAEKICQTQQTLISNGWDNYLYLLPGKWSNNGTHDLIAYHGNLEEMNMYTFKPDGYRFYSGYKKVGHSWGNYSHLLVGNWTNNGTDDLLACHKSMDDINLYTFKADGSKFYYDYKTVGHGWSQYSKFLVGKWTNNGTDDLMAYDPESEEIHLYIFKPDGTGFYPKYKKVGYNWGLYEYMIPGNWTNNSTDDLLSYDIDTEALYLHPFNSNTNSFESNVMVVSDIRGYKEFFTHDWKNDQIDDLIGITENNQVYLFENNGRGQFKKPYFLGVFYNLKEVLKGDW